MVGQTTAPRERALLFGPFRLFVAERMLLEGDKPLRLGSRALEILITLVEHAGDLVSKRDLVSIVWPDTVVVEANLTVHVAALRRALGDGQAGGRYIVNSPGRGYRFVAPITFADESTPKAPQPATTTRLHNLPAQLTRLIGRTEVVKDLVQRLSMQRLLTVVGPPGIGKTAVALGVAEELLPDYQHGVWLIDLAPIGISSLVPSALASALRLEIRSDDPLPDLIAALRDKQILLVFDNCEHVIEAAAALASAILKGSRGVRVVATSREPLRIEGERVYRLPALESPVVSAGLSADEALGFTAIQLFVERAAAATNYFELSDEDAASAARICRELDGNPLAIEFAAGRVDTFGIQGLAARLDDRLRLLADRHRGTLPRHRTITAALDWSYQLLSPAEQIVFRHLAIFAGGFTLESAEAVTADADSKSDIATTIANLVMKSLVATEVRELGLRYRLLEIARAFAMVKLIENDEASMIARRHAVYYQDLLDATPNSPSNIDFAAAYAAELDNLRSALTWAFAPGGDQSIAVALSAASAPIWLEMSLLTECRGRMRQALDVLATGDRGTRREMVLQTEFGFALMYTLGGKTAARAALIRASDLAARLGEPGYELRAIAGMTIFCLRLEDFRGALALAQRGEMAAKGTADPVAILTADVLFSAALLCLGEHARAMSHAERALRQLQPVERRRPRLRAGIDYITYARTNVATILSLRGQLDQAVLAAQSVMDDAAAGGHAASMCFALTWCGCAVSLRIGDLEKAERSINLLRDCSEKHSLINYQASALGYQGLLMARRGEIVAGEASLRAALDGLCEAQFEVQYTPFLVGLAEVVAMSGRPDEALALADEAMQRTERNDVFWCMPETLRIRGEILLSNKDVVAAEELFRRSLDLAQRQNALFWELRTAMSLGKLRMTLGGIRDAHDILNSVYKRFTEGFETADLQRAELLLKEWVLS